MKRPDIPVLAEDKANHLIWGLATFTLGAYLALLAGLPLVHAAAAALLGCALLGVGWEVFQAVTKTGEPSWADALATFCGGVFGVVNLCAVQLLELLSAPLS